MDDSEEKKAESEEKKVDSVDKMKTEVSEEDLVGMGLLDPSSSGDTAAKKKDASSVEEQAAEEQASGRPPLPPGAHHRKVLSWDLSNEYSPTLKALEEPSSPPSKLSLRDLAAQSPLETEAEAYVMRALEEETDPTRAGGAAGPSEAEQTLLSGVPADIAHDFALSDEKEGVPNKQGNKTTLPTHRKEKTTAQALFDLTDDLKQIQMTGSDSRGTSAMYDKGDEPYMSSADIFARNATHLLKRTKATRKLDVELETIPEERNRLSSSADASHRMTTGDEETGSPDVAAAAVADESPTNRKRRRKRRNILFRAKDEATADFREFEEWLKFRKGTMIQNCKKALIWIVVCTGVAAILYYLADNPPCQDKTDCTGEVANYNATSTTKAAASKIKDIFEGSDIKASASWWILFVGVRQIITLSFAGLTEDIIVDFFAIRTSIGVRSLGPFVTLFLVQSKGWPFILFFWSLYDLALLYGGHSFADHWLYWQTWIDLFNKSNPPGEVTQADSYRTLLMVCLCISAVVAVKRFWLGLFLGRKTFARYGQDLAHVMRKTLLVGKVASLSWDLEKNYQALDKEVVEDISSAFTRASSHEGSSTGSPTASSKPPSMRARLESVGSYHSAVTDQMNFSISDTVRIKKLLGDWEEPNAVDQAIQNITIAAIIQFRQSLSTLNTNFPFGVRFGLAGTRVECIASSEKVYKSLMRSNEERAILSFETLALVAVDPDGTLNQEKLKELVKVFRPDRDGNLTLLDFAKSVDAVYRDLRLLRANVANNSKIDHAFERLFNFVFYTIMFFVVLGVAGLDPWKFFFAISGIIVGFGFMIGAASSKYIEGLLFVLVRRPFDIGDRINVSNVNTDTPTTGSLGWIVKDVGLYTTTVVLAASNEMATYSNGSLASSRIINAQRSPQAVLNFLLKFPIDVSYTKLQAFRSALEEFVKARPREWLIFLAFRPTRVEVDFGFVEYMVVAQHRESWQNLGALLNSRAELSSFSLELSKKMGMRYHKPPMPIDLTMKEGSAADLTMTAQPTHRRGGTGGFSSGSVDLAALTAMFEKK